MIARTIGARLLAAAPTVFGVLVCVFVVLHLAPGDPVEAMLGEGAPAADREALRRAWGLDKPLWAQFALYLADLARGDWGVSLIHGEPVLAMIAERLPATLLLAASALALAVGLGVPLGIAAARASNRWPDALLSSVSLLGVSIPNFWLGPMLMLVFALKLGWLPVSGMEEKGSLVLPTVTLGTALAAILMRMTRAAILEAMSSDAIRTARAFGVPERVIWWRDALRLAAPPIVTVFGLQLGALLGGAVITETVFDWPGIGRLTIHAIQARDYPLAQGCILVIALGYVAANLVADLLALWLDPRQREARG